MLFTSHRLIWFLLGYFTRTSTACFKQHAATLAEVDQRTKKERNLLPERSLLRWTESLAKIIKTDQNVSKMSRYKETRRKSKGAIAILWINKTRSEWLGRCNLLGKPQKCLSSSVKCPVKYTERMSVANQRRLWELGSFKISGAIRLA